MKAKNKLFTVSSRDPDNYPVETRLIRAQTARQVEKFLEAEVLKDLWAGRRVEVATVDEAVELGAAGVKVESLDVE